MTDSRGERSAAGQIMTRELYALLLLCALGAGLRLVFPHRLAVEHFDEGVYASNLFFGTEDQGTYPSLHLYAPPLVPAMIEWLFVFFGPSDLAAMAPGVAAGCLTIPLIWWIGREWFGPSAGLMAAALAALSDVHIIYSRTALVDVHLCFWCFAALYCLWRAFRDSSAAASMAAGVCTSLGWWTKYNGWLPLAIALAALCGFSLRSWWQRFTTSPASTSGRAALAPGPGRGLRCFAIALAVALIGWLPYLLWLHDHGGYAAVAANHRNYVVGFSGWFDSAWQFGLKLGVMEGWSSYASIVLGLGLATLSTPAGEAGPFGSTWNLTGRTAISAILAAALLLACWVAGLARGLALASFLALPAVMLQRTGNPAAAEPGRSLALWFVASAFVGLSAATPLYTPYPRLALPWLMSTWLGMGMAACCLLRIDTAGLATTAGASAASPATRPARFPAPWAAAVALLLTLGMIGHRAWIAADRAHESRLMARDVAAWVAERLREQVGPLGAGQGDRMVVYVYGEPAVLFQLRLLGHTLVRPVQDLDFARTESPDPQAPTFVLVGPHARRTSNFDVQRQSAVRLVAMGTLRQPAGSVVVRLDERESIGQDSAGLPVLPQRFDEYALFRVR